MSNDVGIFTTVINGCFTLVSGYFLWKLKTATEEREKSFNHAKERREELKKLYSDLFVMFEQAIRMARAEVEYKLDKETSTTNARVRLLASPGVIEKYLECIDLLEEWSILYFKATPRRTKNPDGSITTILQAPDPTAKYKEPERNVYKQLQIALDLLVKEMRSDLTKGT